MEKIRLIGRSSRLSLLQLEIVKKKIEAAYPEIVVQIIARDSRGDALQDVPLHTVEGSDFFTQDIFAALTNNEADIAVHSLKDMSSEHFFGSNQFAVVDRDDTRDVVILSPGSKIQKGETLIIGTCSPRREEMAIGFLQKALPRLNKEFKIVTKDIRGNVDTRLRKLNSREYDGIILATAGLNRLLNSKEDAPAITELLKDKKILLLPLIECVPAPCQGAIVAEASPFNNKAVEVLHAINDPYLMETCTSEKRTAKEYGVGCLQKFGVTTINYQSKSPDAVQVVYAAGKNSEGEIFTSWTGLPAIDVAGKNVFSTTDFMGNFFGYEYDDHDTTIDEEIVYVANYKSAEKTAIVEQLKKKRVWASGTKTWFELAKKGIWVEGCADAFGYEFLQETWQMPLLDIDPNDAVILTSREGAAIWKAKGWKAYGSYSAKEKYLPAIQVAVESADIIFWTSYRQYQQYKNVTRENVVHVCSQGETEEQFKAAGIKPVVFPNIKAFQQWKQTSIPLRNGG